MSTAHGWRRIAVACLLVVVLVSALLLVFVGPQRLGQVVGTIQRLAQARAASLFHFYRPATNADAATLAAASSVIILNEGDEPYREQLKSSGYQGAVQQYVLVMEAHGPPFGSSGCDASVVPADNVAPDDAGDLCRLTEEMFVHNSRGERLYYTQGGGSRFYYFMNPTNRAWQDLWLERMRADVATLGYDGIFLDNLDVYIGYNRWVNWDGAVQEYPEYQADPTRYREAVRDWLARIKSETNVPIGANVQASYHDGSDWDMFLPYLDATMNESFAGGYPPSYRRPAAWEGDATQAEKVQEAGRVFLAVSQGEQNDLARMRFSLASWFLVDQGLSHFRYASSSLYREFWDYPELHLDLGEPLGPRYRDGDTAWKRDFSCGWVRVDLVDHSSELAQDDSLSTCAR